MSLTTPPPLLPRPKPPGLGAGQKTLIGLALVLTLALTVLSILFVAWTQRATKDKGLQFGVLHEAKQRRAERFEAYKDALAGLPAGTLPLDWSTTNALRAFESDDLSMVHTLAEVFFSGGNQFLPLDLVQLARTLDAEPDPSELALSIHPKTHKPDEIEKNLLQYLRDSKDLKDLYIAAHAGIYYLDIDPTIATWEQELGEDGIPDRHGPAMVLAFRAQLEARHGNFERAIEAYLEAVRLAELLGSDPYLSYQTLRYELEWRADCALWEMAAKWDPTEAALQQIQDAVARRADTVRLKELVIEEADLEFPRTMSDEGINNPFIGKISQMMGLYDPAKTHEAALKLASFLDMPFADTKRFVEQLDDDGNEKAVYLGDVPGQALDARRQQLRSTLTSDAIQLALALKRYKADRGVYPPSLDALIPEYMRAAPVDPVTDHAIEYLTWDDGYFLFAPSDPDDEDVTDYEDYGYYYYGDTSHYGNFAYGEGYTRNTLWHARQ